MEDTKTLPETAAGEVAPVAHAAPNPMLALIDQWFVDHFHNAITSRDTEIFNYCQSAKEELKRRVAAL
ncbi:hypothetical protein [Trinickia mobilis]|uniref:hypothetical protein n=1 Tax=Trinickia mobilis TaxID=2816356 RepID=UPI001A8C5E2A|nr:hypothetical protein [Trinickia mobilis]